METGYRKVICGDYATASRYFVKAEKMLIEAERRGVKKLVYDDPSIIIIAKWIGSRPQAIFITLNPFLIIFLHSVTVENVVHYYAWDGQALKLAAEIDLKEYFDPVPGSLASEIPPLIEKESYIILRPPAPSLVAPYYQFPIRRASSRKIKVRPGETFQYDPSSFRWQELFRGTDSDFIYTAAIDGADAEIHSRIWPEQVFTLEFDLPVQNKLAFPAEGLDWPATSFETYFPKAFNVIGNDIYVVGSDNSSLYTYNEIWKYDADLITWTAEIVFNVFYAGGLSYRHFGCQLYNVVDSQNLISLDEWLDNAGDPSDLQLVLDLDGGTVFSFSPGDTLGYSRTLSNETRISFTWKIADGIYGYQVQNTSQPVSPSSQIPDSLWLVDITDATPIFTLVYQAPEGYRLETPHVNPDRPSLIYVGEEIRHGTGTETVYYFDMLTSEKKTIIADRSVLTSGRFIQ